MNTAATAVQPTPITLTQDQQAAYDRFVEFVLAPHDDVFVLAGYSGTGKTTLVKEILHRVSSIERTLRLVDPQHQGLEIELTATTNKAAEAFAHIAHQPVRTIHSLLGLTVETDFKTRQTRLVARNGGTPQVNKLIFIDEASYIDQTLLRTILALTQSSKVVFIGDPAQLTPVGNNNTPVFSHGFPKAELTEVVRQAKGNPIIDLATQLRHMVNTGQQAMFTPDGQTISHVSRDEFNALMLDSFSNPNWHFHDSKFLGWTNKCCIAHNKMLCSQIGNSTEFAVGDYVVNNRYLGGFNGQPTLKTDEIVQITERGNDDVQHGSPGVWYKVNHSRSVFVPHARTAYARVCAALIKDDQSFLAMMVEHKWADLRALYACTINKAQGSTFHTVFIDLDDVNRCRDDNQLARLLYVAVSRASHRVIMTGDLS